MQTGIDDPPSYGRRIMTSHRRALYPRGTEDQAVLHPYTHNRFGSPYAGLDRPWAGVQDSATRGSRAP
ncbi:hypothetical protein [Streptomyces exfoliatus]|uniref:hypothetical protein n=1 Tax=Streptomyces exfoliatus TaxID=1905 RepID=UPI003C300A0C